MAAALTMTYLAPHRIVGPVVPTANPSQRAKQNNTKIAKRTQRSAAASTVRRGSFVRHDWDSGAAAAAGTVVVRELPSKKKTTAQFT